MQAVISIESCHLVEATRLRTQTTVSPGDRGSGRRPILLHLARWKGEHSTVAVAASKWGSATDGRQTFHTVSDSANPQVVRLTVSFYPNHDQAKESHDTAQDDEAMGLRTTHGR